METKPKILIVDDRPENIIALEKVLEETDAVLIKAFSGNEALIQSLHHEFALAILDVQMPEMDGYELAMYLGKAQKTQHMPIIFLTAFDSLDYEVLEAYKSGCVDFICKPYHPEILRAKVNVFLQLHRQKQILVEKLELERSKKYLENIFSSMSDAVMVSSLDGCIQKINKATTALMEIDEEQIIGEPLSRFFLDYDEVSTLFIPHNRFEPHDIKPFENKECMMINGTGDMFPVSLTLSFFRDRGGKIIGLVLVVMDIRMQKKAEEERHKLEDQLRHAQKMEAIGQLAGGVAHDFNNIIHAIQGYSSLLLELTDPCSKKHEFIQEIFNSTERAGALTRQLLAFSRKQIIESRDLDLNALIKNFLKMIARVIGEHIMLDFKPFAGSLRVHADPGQLEQILINLCINARDAMDNGGELVISTRHKVLDKEFCQIQPWAEPGDYAVLTVSDTGCGMNAYTQSRIFEPFFTTKQFGQGTGLGLATVFGIITQHNGLIQVQSEVGSGSTFHIYFHRVALREQPPQIPPASPAKTTGGSETILLAEDEDSVRRLTARMLRHAGYQVLTASNATEAKEIIAKNHPLIDLALLDMVMPGGSGKDVHDYFINLKPEAHTIFMSGYSGGIKSEDIINRNQIAFLQKPFGIETLFLTIRRCLLPSSSNLINS